VQSLEGKLFITVRERRTSSASRDGPQVKAPDGETVNQHRREWATPGNFYRGGGGGVRRLPHDPAEPLNQEPGSDPLSYGEKSIFPAQKKLGEEASKCQNFNRVPWEKGTSVLPTGTNEYGEGSKLLKRDGLGEGRVSKKLLMGGPRRDTRGGNHLRSRKIEKSGIILGGI